MTGEDTARAFGEFLRAQRQLANISQRQLARLSGVSDSYLSQVERGLYRPSIDVMKALALAFGLSPGALYVQFGFMDAGADVPTGTDVEGAIRRDDRLSAQQKSALLVMYRALVEVT